MKAKVLITKQEFDKLLDNFNEMSLDKGLLGFNLEFSGVKFGCHRFNDYVELNFRTQEHDNKIFEKETDEGLSGN